MFTEIIDISWPVKVGMLSYPGDCLYQVRQTLFLEKGDACNLSCFEMSMHNGTHIDAPLHFIAEGKPVSKLALDFFLGRAKVILIETKDRVTVDHLRQFKVENGDRLLLKIPHNESLLDNSVFCNDYAALDQTAAAFLAEKGVRLVGIEYLSIEEPENPPNMVHRILLARGVIILEGIDLRKVSPGEYFLSCLPLNLEGANGSPVRAVLMR